MPRKQKINLEKVLAALKTLCPKCGYVIPLSEIRRFDFNTMKCPKCGEHFVVTKDNQA
ncbi:MAG: zf-TFIIB domain-containing protein [Candidatus Sulfotelmatobacter sp.]